MRNFLLVVTFLACTILNAGQALAVPTLTLDAPDSVSSGHNLQVTIGISGMESGIDLGAFSFDFYFTPKDNAVFIPALTYFGNQLGSDTESIRDLSIIDFGINAKKIEVYEVSLLTDLSSQLDNFALITIGLYPPSFPGLANKTLGVEAKNFVLSDANGNQIFADNTLVGKFIILYPIPEPKTLALITFGLIGIGFFGRWRSAEWSGVCKA